MNIIQLSYLFLNTLNIHFTCSRKNEKKTPIEEEDL